MSTAPVLVTLQDFDAVLKYSPSVDSGTAGWTTTYPSGQYYNNTVGPPGSQQGQGNSLRSTSTAGATLSFSFYGTSLTLYGSASSSKYTVQLDSGTADSKTESNGVLASYTGLEAATHTVQLTVTTPSPSLSFDMATFNADVVGTWSNQTIVSPASNWHLDSGWYPQTNTWGDGSTQQLEVCHTNGCTATLSFTGAEVVYLMGTLVSDHGPYQVGLNGTYSTFTGQSKYSIPFAVTYFQGGLDPSQTYILSVEGLSTGYLDIVEAMLVACSANCATTSGSGNSASSGNGSGPTSTSGSSPSTASGDSAPATTSHKSNVGAIVGGSVGAGLAVAAVILIAAFFYLRRQRQHQRGIQDIPAGFTGGPAPSFVSSGGNNTQATPWSPYYPASSQPGSVVGSSAPSTAPAMPTVRSGKGGAALPASTLPYHPAAAVTTDVQHPPAYGA